MLPENISLKFLSSAIFYFLLDFLIFILFVFRIVALNDFSLLAAVHLFTIGFVIFTIFGAMEQMVPVLSASKLYSERLAKQHFYATNIAFLGFIASLLLGLKRLAGFFSVLLFIAFCIFIFIIFKTIKHYNLVLKFFGAGLIYFFLASLLGMLSMLGIFTKKPLHVHLALIGFVSFIIFGALYHMLPMLSLRKLYSERLANLHFYASNLGIIALSFSFLTGKFFKFSAILMLFAFYLFAYIMLRTLFQKKLEFAKLDVSVKFFIFSIIFMLIATTIGAYVASFFKYGFLSLHYHIALVGFVTLTIFGGMYHVVPMLVWINRYSSKIGKERIPSVKELYNANEAGYIFLASTIAVFLLLFAFFMKNSMLEIISTILFFIASLAFSYRMLRIIYS